jgi:hypothetical protein
MRQYDAQNLSNYLIFYILISAHSIAAKRHFDRMAELWHIQERNMAGIILDGFVFIIQATLLAGLAYGGLLCLNAESMFQVARKARAVGRSRPVALQGYVVAAHS